MSERVSEVSERENEFAQRSERTSEWCERTSEETSEWPSTYVPILGCSAPLCSAFSFIQQSFTKTTEVEREVNCVDGLRDSAVNDTKNGKIASDEAFYKSVSIALVVVVVVVVGIVCVFANVCAFAWCYSSLIMIISNPQFNLLETDQSTVFGNALKKINDYLKDYRALGSPPFNHMASVYHFLSTRNGKFHTIIKIACLRI